MASNIKYTNGQLINGFNFIRELPYYSYINPKGFELKYRMAIFECGCGKTFEYFIKNVKKRVSPWCDDCSESFGIRKVTKHGDSKSLDSLSGIKNHKYLYNAWSSIKQRCYNKKLKSYKNYGGRGLSMYKPWLNNYVLFKNWILTNLGERPEGYSLDRINNDRGYMPNNLRWATKKQQVNNSRERGLKQENVNSIVRLIRDNILSVSDIAEAHGVHQSTIYLIKNNKTSKYAKINI